MVRITTEGTDIFLGPSERVFDIANGRICRTTNVGIGRTIGQTKNSQPMVAADKDKFSRQVEETFRGIAQFAATVIASSPIPVHDWELFVGTIESFDGSVHITEQAVLSVVAGYIRTGLVSGVDGLFNRWPCWCSETSGAIYRSSVSYVLKFVVADFSIA